MIGKHIPSPKSNGSFGGLNDYITGKSKRRLESEKVAFTDCVNLISVETATTEMESLAIQNKRCGDPVMHLLLSWRENENPTREQVKEAVKIALDEMNLAECQAVYALHQNTDNMHLHICVNRINPNTLRAINPAHGWTRRGMERAARRIEHAQGWQTENNTWSEINEQGEAVMKPKPEVQNRPIPQKVQDMENLTGEQSAIRKAQNILKEHLKGLTAWEDFYNLLSKHGMKYQKKGSGAVITIDGVTVKASDVSCNLTLAKLENRFGAYRIKTDAAIEEKPVETVVRKPEPKPLHKANTDNPNWKAYITERRDYLKTKKERRERLFITQRKEIEELNQRQKAERQSLAALSGKGISRRELNRQRSILATKHAYDRATLKATHDEQRKQIKSAGDAYSSYENWLRSHDMEEEAELWRHRKNKHVMILTNGGEGRTNAEASVIGILGFKMAAQKGKTVFTSIEALSVNGTNAVTFVDLGKIIKIHREDENSLLAALQLARQKWGAVKIISGSEDFKRQVSEIAAKNGIKVVNPELRPVIGTMPVKPTLPITMTPDEAREYKDNWIRETINARTAEYEREMSEKLNAMREKEKTAVSALEKTKEAKPPTDALGALPVFKQWYERKLSNWQGEMDSAEAKVTAAGKAISSHEREAADNRKRIAADTAREFDALNPSLIAIIRNDEQCKERETAEQERKEAESRSKLKAAILELAAALNKKITIITDARDGRNYSGLMLGTAESDGCYYALQYIYDGHVIRHRVTKDELPVIERLKGGNVEIFCIDWKIGAIRLESEQGEQKRGWLR